MKVPLKQLLLVAVLMCVIVGCTTKPDHKKVKITIQSTNQLNAEVKLSREMFLERTILLESRTDSNGHCSIELTVQKPMFVLIQIGERYGELHLAPDYDFVIYDVDLDYRVPLTFSGKGAATNNYVSWVNSNVEKIKWANDKGVSELNRYEFFDRYDSLKETIANFHQSYLDSVRLSNETIAKLEQKNRIKFAAVAQEYYFYQLNNAINEKRAAQEKGSPFENVVAREVDMELDMIVNDILFDSTLLGDEGYADYQVLLNFYWHNKIHLPTAKIVAGRGNYSLLPVVSDSLIRRGNFPEAIREYLAARNFQYWLAAFGIAPETNAVFDGFKRKYQHSKYLPALNKNVEEWLAVAPGNPAPNFEGYTQSGDTISLQDLKGKLVYVDVWATWCSPCVAEIPAAKKLQKDFLKSMGIQFLNVSVDSDRSEWEKFLQKEKNWKGLHIIIDPGKIQSFYTDYKLLGVPGYIIIDSSGKIVNMKAPRPSAPEIIDEIIKLLAAEK